MRNSKTLNSLFYNFQILQAFQNFKLPINGKLQFLILRKEIKIKKAFTKNLFIQSLNENRIYSILLLLLTRSY